MNSPSSTKHAELAAELRKEISGGRYGEEGRLPSESKLDADTRLEHGEELRQPCQEMAISAFRAMLDRLVDPSLPARSISLTPGLVVRESCGAYAKG